MTVLLAVYVPRLVHRHVPAEAGQLEEVVEGWGVPELPAITPDRLRAVN